MSVILWEGNIERARSLCYRSLWLSMVRRRMGRRGDAEEEKYLKKKLLEENDDDDDEYE